MLSSASVCMTASRSLSRRTCPSSALSVRACSPARRRDWAICGRRFSTISRSGTRTNCSGAGGRPVRRNETASSRLTRRRGVPDVAWSDARLIRACLNGNEQAWSALIQKYRNLIYSIPLKYGASPEDAADIFQAVCLELFSELPRLRKKAAFRSWLITVTAHQSFQWKRKIRRRAEDELTAADEANLGMDPSPDFIEQVEREQMLRDAIARLP